MSGTRSHWDHVYERKASQVVSWYRPHLDRSLSWIDGRAAPSDALVDVGGGASTLVDDLLDRGFLDVTVLDVSATALQAARARLGPRAAQVQWVEAEIADWRPTRRHAVWHDRAVFHFMTTPAQRAAYVATLRAGTAPGAFVIMGTFALDGPGRCSGLPVQRYSAETLAACLGEDFVLVDRAEESHETPSGAEQRFSWCLLRRSGGSA